MSTSKPNATLVEFERHTGLGPTFAARLLGLPYISYAQYRSGMRQLKTQHLYHVEVLMLLDRRVLHQRIKEIVYATQ